MCLAIVRKWLHTCSKCIIVGSLSNSLLFTHDTRLLSIYTFVCSEHYLMIEREGGHDIEKKHKVTFESWFQNNIYNGKHKAKNVSKQLYHLSLRPDRQIRLYRGCIVNRVRFYIKECAKTRTTQSSEFVVKGGYNTSDDEYNGELKNIF